MVPGMDLQTQYDKTLQNTIGQSQRQRNEAFRNVQEGSTDWDARGVSGFRGAGFNEVNPPSMPVMDETTRGYLAPVLGTYQEGGKNREGYYGKTNPYTIEGALKYASNAGYTQADSTLEQQVKNAGQTLPSIFGHSLANQDIRNWGQQAQQPQQSSWNGFTPGKDNGDWKWVNGAGPQAMLLELAFANQNSGAVDSDGIPFIRNQEELAADKWRQDYLSTVSPEGSGTWYNDKDPMHGIDYRPGQGYSYTEYDSAPKGFNKYMPALTMAALGAMTGGAGYAIGGGAAGGATALGGQALGAAIPSTMQTGLTTGDWGNALKTGALSAAGSGLGGIYGGDLGKYLGLSGKIASGVGSGLIGAGTNAIGNALMGRNVDWASALGSAIGNAGGSYLGDLANSAIGGTLGEAVGNGVKTLSKGLSNGLASGKGLDLRDIATRTALGAVSPTLSNLFSDTSISPQERDQNTKLASNLTNAMYKNNKRL